MQRRPDIVRYRPQQIGACLFFFHFQTQFPQIEVETSMPEEVVMAPMDGILVEQVDRKSVV